MALNLMLVDTFTCILPDLPFPPPSTSATSASKGRYTFQQGNCPLIMENKQSAGDTRVNDGMASRSTAPHSLLTTSRHLCKQLQHFKWKLVRRNNHQMVRCVLNEFGAVAQALLDVEESQDKVIRGLEGSEPVPLLSHQLPEEFLVEDPPRRCCRVVPTRSAETVGVPYVRVDDEQFSPRNPMSSPTLKAARDHLLWKHKPTPFTSVFDGKQRALEWAAMLQARHEDVQFVLLELNTSTLRSRLLYDATEIAKYLDLLDFRVNYHHGEYFWFGPIGGGYVESKSLVPRGRRFEQSIDPTTVDCFDSWNEETIKYASDARSKRRGRKASEQKSETSQALMTSDSDDNQKNDIVEESSDSGTITTISEQPSTKRRYSALDSPPSLPEAPKRAKVQHSVGESRTRSRDRLAPPEGADSEEYREYWDCYDTAFAGASDPAINKSLNRRIDGPVTMFMRRVHEWWYWSLWKADRRLANWATEEWASGRIPPFPTDNVEYMRKMSSAH